MRYLSAELRRLHSGESYLFKLLHSTWFGIPLITIARFASGVSKKGTAEAPVYWREDLLAMAEVSTTSSTNPDKTSSNDSTTSSTNVENTSTNQQEVSTKVSTISNKTVKSVRTSVPISQMKKPRT
jgi:hypothetical protein